MKTLKLSKDNSLMSKPDEIEAGAKPRVLISKEVLSKIDEDCDVYGITRPEEGLIQVICTQSEYRGVPLDRVGRISEGVIDIEEYRISLEERQPVLVANATDVLPEIAYFDISDYDKRNRGLVHSVESQGKQVLIVGAGSGGSRQAAALARHGVFASIVDCAFLEIHNGYRWGIPVVPELAVGRSKAFLAKELLDATIPGANISAYHLDFSAEFPIFEGLAQERKYDLLIVTTDTLNSHRDAMLLAYRQEIPILYVLLGDKAESGMIAYYPAGADFCHLCFSASAQDMQLSVKKDNKQYGIEAEEEQHGVPALSVDIDIVNSIGAKIALAVLAEEDAGKYFEVFGNTGNILFFSTKPDAWIMEDAFQKICLTVEKNPTCPLCGEPDLERIRQKHEKPERTDTAIQAKV
jgi:ThiF family